jgi:hypothetical protein
MDLYLHKIRILFYWTLGWSLLVEIHRKFVGLNLGIPTPFHKITIPCQQNNKTKRMLWDYLFFGWLIASPIQSKARLLATPQGNNQWKVVAVYTNTLPPVRILYVPPDHNKKEHTEGTNLWCILNTVFLCPIFVATLTWKRLEGTAYFFSLSLSPVSLCGGWKWKSLLSSAIPALERCPVQG